MKLEGLNTKVLGRNLMFFETLDSTQKKVKSLKRPENGTIVIANEQTAGIGTHDRKWFTGTGKNIAMSFVLFPGCNIQKISSLTTSIAECITCAIEKVCGNKLDIKEPNDIYYRRQKGWRYPDRDFLQRGDCARNICWYWN